MIGDDKWGLDIKWLRSYKSRCCTSDKDMGHSKDLEETDAEFCNQPGNGAEEEEVELYKEHSLGEANGLVLVLYLRRRDGEEETWLLLEDELHTFGSNSDVFG